MTPIVLSKDVRAFKKINGGSKMDRVDESFSRGTSIVVGEPCFLTYKNRSRLVLAVIGTDAFLMAEEIGTLDDRKLRD